MADDKIVWSPLPGSQTLAMSCPAQIIVYHGSRGPGKSIANEINVLCDSGFKPAGDVTYDDKLVAIDGTYVNVLGIYPQGVIQLYNVEFFDGEIVEACAEHRWLSLNSKTGYREGWKVRTTKQIMEMKVGCSVPYLQGGIQGKRWCGLDPYMLGYIIANGTTGSARVTIYSIDDEILDYANKEHGWNIHVYDQTARRAICPQYQDNLWREALESHKIGDKKCVPKGLLESDPETRLALLQGLMDGDGSCESGAKSRYSTVSEQLAKDVVYLVKSLGGWANYRKQIFSDEQQLKRKGGSEHSRNWIYRVDISHHNKFNPFRLERKASQYKEQKKYLTRGIKSITPSRMADAVCFEVDHPDHCFIVGDFVVTHNTDSQLMRFRSRVGQGYGRHWRGIIFDREYKNLDDLVSKSMRWFPEFKDGCRFINSKSDYKWVWKTGEELLFRTVKKDADYWSYHGQEFCLESSSMICTPTGDVPIKNIKVGDYVLTAVGPRKVTRVFPEKQKPCVQATVFDKSGNVIGQSKFSESHKVLSSDLKLWTQHCDGNRSVFLFVLLKILQKAWIRRVLCFRLKSLAVFFDPLPSTLKIDVLGRCNQHHVFLKFHEFLNHCYNRLLTIPFLNPKSQLDDEKIQLNVQNDDKEFHNSPLAFSLFRESRVLQSILMFPFCQEITQYRLQISKILQVLCKFVSLDGVNSLIFDKEYLGRYSVLKFLLQIVYSLKGYAQLLNALHYLGRVRGYLSYCLLYCNQYDEQLRVEEGTVREISLLNADDIRHILGYSQKDDLAYTLQNSHSYDSLRYNYVHPYTHEYNRAILPFQEGKLLSVPCGILNTIDIEVDGANSYVIPSNLLSCNCFIGWNELTKYPNGNLFEMMMSCNRSSFRPEDAPYYINGLKFERDNVIEYVSADHRYAEQRLLPEIPLEVFATCNPHGSGHTWVKRRFISASPMGKILRNTVNVYNPRTQKREDVVKTQVHIFGSYRENKYLSPEYVATLESIDEPNKKKAWLHGDWDVVAGGMFDDLWDSSQHVVTPFKIPESWRIDRSFDWGSSAPFSVGWWAESDGSEVVLPNGKTMSTVRGDIFRIKEWYGSNGRPNEGLRMLAEDVAAGIVERELSSGLHLRVVPGPADNSIYNVENGNSIGASMASKVKVLGKVHPGVTWMRSDKSSGSRKAGWEKIRTYLRDAKQPYLLDQFGKPILDKPIPREKPGLFVFNTCKNFIDLVPCLPRSEKDPDDVDSDAEDHIGDEVRYKILSIGLGARGGKTKGTQ